MKTTKRAMAVLAGALLLIVGGGIFTACGGDDGDDSVVTPATETSGTTAVSGLSALKVGMKVTYNKKEYLVTKNSFVSDSSPGLYEIFNADGKKVARIRQVWNSGTFVSYFFPEVQATDDARAEKFMELGEDTIREYDPHTIFIDVTDSSKMENNKCIELVYAYYKDTHTDITEDDEKYKKIDLDSLPTTRKDNLGYAKVTVNGESKLVPAYRKETSSYSTNYCLQDSSWSRYAVLSIPSSGDSYWLTLYGEGKFVGSTNESDYYQNVRITSDESADATHEENLTVTDSSEVVTGTDYPVTKTYHAHFAKNADDPYPPLDAFTKITLSFDETTTSYTLTKTALNDFLAAYSTAIATYDDATGRFAASTN